MFWLLLFFFAATGFTHATQIFNLEEIEKELDRADEKTLVVFDVDEVLITTEDHFVHPYAYSTFFPIVLKHMARSPDKKEFEEIASLCFLLPKRTLIEETTPDFIKRIQGKGIKTIALTACDTGPLGLIPKVELWRVEDLRSFGIDFSFSFLEHQRIVLTELTSSANPSPLFEQGVLFSKGYTKGEVLKAFLHRVDFHPSKIVFIDDRRDHLENVEKELQALKIPHRVFHYTGASRFAKPVDEKLLQYQLDHLIKHREWLTDGEVKARLERIP